MAFYVKTNGEWQIVADPQIRTSSVWNRINEGWVKQGGVWQRFYYRDTTAPPAPSIKINDKVGERGFNVEVSGSSQSAVKVSLWKDRDSVPSTTEGNIDQVWAMKNYHSGGQQNADNRDVYDWDVPRVEGSVYYAKAVVYDAAGNRSEVATDQRNIQVAPGANQDHIDPGASWSWSPRLNAWRTDNHYVYQGGETLHKGCWFYFERLDKLKGKEIINMRIFISRLNTAHGQTGQSNVWLGHHGNRRRTENDPLILNETKIGTIARGEKKWFDVPKSWWDGFGINNGANYRGLALRTTDVGTGSQNHIITHAAEDDVGNGRLFVEWRA